jgi:hypothetical protein
MRGALMGAAALLDALAVDIAAQHKVRGRVTKDGQRLAAMVTDCASTILSMREKIEVPHG